MKFHDLSGAAMQNLAGEKPPKSPSFGAPSGSGDDDLDTPVRRLFGTDDSWSDTVSDSVEEQPVRQRSGGRKKKKEPAVEFFDKKKPKKPAGLPPSHGVMSETGMSRIWAMAMWSS